MKPVKTFLRVRIILDKRPVFSHRMTARRFDPKNIRYLMGLAQGFYAAGRIDDSIAVLDRVLDIEAGHGPATQFRNKLSKEREAAGG